MTAKDTQIKFLEYRIEALQNLLIKKKAQAIRLIKKSRNEKRKTV